MRKHLGFLLLLLLQLLPADVAAQVTGQVIDARSKEPLDYVYVYYEGRGIGDQTDEKGQFVLRDDSLCHELTVSTLGYVTQKIPLIPGKTRNLKIKLVPETHMLQTVNVVAKNHKYSRKNNPAVELMKKVIDAKKYNDLHSKDFFSFSSYEKMTFSINEFTEKIFELEEGKRWSFLKKHVEYCKETGKLILPLTVDEALSTHYYRKDPKAEKILIKGKNSRGINELINTGEILNSVLKDCITNVNIYDEECRLLKLRFKSPIANSAIGFYRYYIQDTLAIEGDSVIDVGFVPNNEQDIGFSGHLFILRDTTYQVRRVEITIPRRSDVNFVESMSIKQDYEELASGERVSVNNDMLIELRINSWLNKLQVQRAVRHFDYSFDPISNQVFKHIKGNVYTEPDATMHTDDNYWKEYRKVELTQSEGEMGSFLQKLTQIKGFKVVMFGAKALIENFIETSDSLQNNKFDFGPINTTISFNHYDDVRFRISGFTTAHLNPHLFWSGYIAYSPKRNNVYGRTELTYSFNRKAYLSREFPKNNIHVSYWNDITSPFDKFVPTDKDNVFMAFHSSKVDQYNHTREFKIMYDREWYDGLKFNATFTRQNNRAVDALFYQRLGTDPNVSTQGMSALTYDPSRHIHDITTSELKVGMSFEPGAAYSNTKQRRIKLNKDAPILSLSHTMGIKGFLGGEYNYNVTEAGFYKRLYIPGGWGYLDTDLKAGIQWNKVPFPLLIHPAANQSYIIMDNCFALISNLEFLNDRYAQAMLAWNLCGKVFNRIPLLHKLQWREYLGINLLWGSLSEKNNPASSNYTDTDLFYFPGHFRNDDNGGTYYENNTVVMNKRVPYIELRLGICNVFKLLHIEYVRRITYLHNPGTNKSGIRFLFRMMF